MKSVVNGQKSKISRQYEVGSMQYAVSSRQKTIYCLLLTPYSLLPTAFCLLLTAYSLLLFTGCAERVTRPLPEISAPKVSYEEGSLWPKEESKLLLFKDTKANKVGDIVTVLIAESSQASKASETKTSRASDNTLGFKAGTGIPTDFQVKGGNKFEGIGTTSRAGKLTATITAVVVEVLPNGNLKIDGVKDIKVNDETQYMTVSGIVRPEDISRNNSVFSTDIADAKILYEGEGSLDDEQRPGWLGKAFKWIWPF